MSFYAGCFALAAGIFVTAAVLWTYQRERRTAYRQFERMGMTRFCRAWYQLTELCVLIVPAAVVGTAAGIGIVWLILWILLQRQNAQARLTLTAFGSVAAWTAVFCVITALWGLYAAQRVDREKQKQKKKLSVWTMRYGQHVIKAGFTGIVVLAVLVCTQKMSAVQNAYTYEKRQPDLMITPEGIIDEKNSDTASESSGTTSSETVLDGEKVMMDYKYDTGKMRVIHGLPQSLTAYIGQMSGIDKTDTALVQNWMVLYYKTKNDTEFYKQYIEENGLENFLNKGVMKYEMPAYSGTRTMTHFVFSKFNGTRSLDYYVAANRAVYEELEDYIDEEYRDYEAFERGEQAVLVIQKGSAGEYVDTCKAGDTLSSSSDYFYWINNNYSSYAVSELYQEYADYMQKMRFSTAEFDAAEEILSDMDDKQEDEIRQEIQKLPETLQGKILYRYRAGKNIYKSENPVTVTAVVYLDEENETAFYEKFPILKEMNAQEYWIMPESVVYNRYQLSAKRMCTVMEKEYDPEQYRALGQNVMTVSYGLSALYQATDEVLRAYLDSYGYSYVSHFEEPTEVTKPTEKPTEAPTEVTKPDNTVTDDTPHMENGSDGKKYWYENGIKQGTEGNGKEIYDPATDAWYWLDAVQGGAVATDKDVNIPDGTENGKWVRYDSEGRMVKGEDYRYGGWYYFDETTGAMTKGFINIADGTDEGKWVRYDENGHMIKSWSTQNGNVYYFDEQTGAMAKGTVKINGQTFTFDWATGILQF